MEDRKRESGVKTQRSSHRVAKRMIERLEKKENIQVDHGKFARLALDPSLTIRIPWTLPGGPKIEIHEKYSMNFWRAMNTPADGMGIEISIKNFDAGEIYESKTLAKTGREVRRRLQREGLHVSHSSEMGVIDEHTFNFYRFELSAHFASYRATLQPIVRSILKAFPSGELKVTVTHRQLEAYAESLVDKEPRTLH